MRTILFQSVLALAIFQLWNLRPQLNGLEVSKIELKASTVSRILRNTPLVSFESEYQAGSGVSRVETGRVRLDQTELERVFDPSHPLADESGHYQGSNVNLLIEVADAREAQRSYEANLKMFEQARQMSSDLMSLLQK